LDPAALLFFWKRARGAQANTVNSLSTFARPVQKPHRNISDQAHIMTTANTLTIMADDLEQSRLVRRLAIALDL
jgi:hypothetical protein